MIFAGLGYERDDPGTRDELPDPHLDQTLPEVLPEQTGSLSHFILGLIYWCKGTVVVVSSKLPFKEAHGLFSDQYCIVEDIFVFYGYCNV